MHVLLNHICQHLCSIEIHFNIHQRGDHGMDWHHVQGGVVIPSRFM